MNAITKTTFVAILLTLGVAQAAEPAAAPPANAPTAKAWGLALEGFFTSKDGTGNPLVVYARERDGQWVSGLGSSRTPKGKRSYNLGMSYVDLTKAPIVNGIMKGPVTVHVTPDLWVPLDHKSFTIDLEVDAKVTPEGKLDGTYKVVAVNSKDKTAEVITRTGGKLGGSFVAKDQEPVPDVLTYGLNLQGLLVGGKPSYGGRAMVVWLGVEKDKVVTASQGRLTGAPKGGVQTYARKNFPVDRATVKREGEKVTGQITVPDNTLDMDPCDYVVDFTGHIHDKNLSGHYVVTVKRAGQPDQRFNGAFDGGWHVGYQKWEIEADDDFASWFTKVPDFQPVAAGEHPRLLFRKRDVPALRERMKSPEGQAILKRLRFLLDGKDGETMAPVFNDATKPYAVGTYQSKIVSAAGVYTFSHAAGYGLLYQLTGDKKYAELGLQCFEKALAGVRDRDDRYSWRDPGGHLRAGPTLGWYAVGYDLCYDGWDAATRARIAKEIHEYAGRGTDAAGEIVEGRIIDLEELIRGKGIPGSNHFGMEIGGATLALLAIAGDPGVNTADVDRLLKLAKNSMVRNITEGFGDGGYFVEGDGAGSMAAYTTYLSALQAWKNCRGEDFVNVDRPNVSMLTLKWIYQSVANPAAMLKAFELRTRKDPNWQVSGGAGVRPAMVARGAYSDNVWEREGLSGAGYFAHGFAGVKDAQKPALLWFYNNGLKDIDEKMGMPYDTVSVYPHLSVAAFVNWPIGRPPVNPAEILPHCYRDSNAGFYVWRSRWQDTNDVVISAMTGRTQGYYNTRPDKGFTLLTQGKKVTWGTMGQGEVKHWQPSPRGQTSSLTMGDGTCLGVDFTNASGADVLLVTTGKAEGPSVKLGEKTLTFYFPTAAAAPEIKVQGQSATIGNQRIEIDAQGNLQFAVKGK